MLVISPVADVRIYQDVWVQSVEDPGKADRIAAITLGKIPVQVQVLGIASEPVGNGPVLVGPGILIPVLGSADII